MPPLKLWVLLKSNDNDSAVVSHPTQVPTKNCDNVDDFVEAVKKKLQLPNPPQEITLHLTEGSPALEPDAALPARNTKQTALVVSIPSPDPPHVSMAYGKADMSFISETTGVQEVQEVWETIPVDETITPSAEFVELFKKNCSVFEFETEASRRIVIDLFLREIVSQFPDFQVICEYHMTVENQAKKRRLNGFCDYTICHRRHRNLPHLVAIVAKLPNKETLLQCIGECSSIHYRRKNAGMPNCQVYGIHSTGSVWKFVFVSQEGIVYVSGEKHLNVQHYVEEGFNHIYRLVHYLIQQSFLNSPRQLLVMKDLE